MDRTDNRGLTSRGQLQIFLLDNLSWVLILVFYALFAVLRPVGMLKLRTVIFIIYSAIPLGFLVLGTSLTLISGRIDLSIAEVAGFVAMLSALFVTKWAPFVRPPFDVLVPLVFGAACGLINGVLVGVVKLNPFLVTLGTSLSFDGATLLLQSFPVYKGFSEPYLAIGGRNYIAIPIVVCIVVLLQVVLKKTRFGSHVYAVGGNPESARMLGVEPNRMYVLIYTFSGLAAGLSALFYTGFLNAVTPGVADGNVFLAFGGAIIGGIALEGGRGSMINAFAGVLFLGLIEAGLSMFNVSPFLRRVIYGALVVLAIWLNKYRSTLRDMILLPKDAASEPVTRGASNPAS
ncbi:MAG: ABC transporter permease [Spirochaetales bacterium]|nr:ABC transporter permease [Spirochaetales bacterium]